MVEMVRLEDGNYVPKECCTFTNPLTSGGVSYVDDIDLPCGADCGSDCDSCVIQRIMNEYQKYQEIGTLEECRAAKKKQSPMRIKEVHVDEYFCPACGSENNCDEKIVTDNYCPVCGQAVKQEG